MMIERFKPGLILLDNYLPDGKGITLLHELTWRVIRAAWCLPRRPSDMETVPEAAQRRV